MRGEKILQALQGAIQVGSSPHARGKVAYLVAVNPKLRIIPACAGKSLKG